jgi:hypothetical protein
MPYSSQGGKGCQAVAVRPFTMDDDVLLDLCLELAAGVLVATLLMTRSRHSAAN